MIYFGPIACAGIKFSNFEISDFVPADGHVRCSQRDFGTSGQQLAKLKVRSIPRMACARSAIVLVADRALSSGSLAILAAIRRASSGGRFEGLIKPKTSQFLALESQEEIMADENFSDNLLRAVAAELHLLNRVTAAREMFSKATVDQTVTSMVGGNYQSVTPEALASHRAREPAG